MGVLPVIRRVCVWGRGGGGGGNYLRVTRRTLQARVFSISVFTSARSPERIPLSSLYLGAGKNRMYKHRVMPEQV
jgi:hypothetical protein